MSKSLRFTPILIVFGGLSVASAKDAIESAPNIIHVPENVQSMGWSVVMREPSPDCFNTTMVVELKNGKVDVKLKDIGPTTLRQFNFFANVYEMHYKFGEPKCRIKVSITPVVDEVDEITPDPFRR